LELGLSQLVVGVVAVSLIYYRLRETGFYQQAGEIGRLVAEGVSSRTMPSDYIAGQNTLPKISVAPVGNDTEFLAILKPLEERCRIVQSLVAEWHSRRRELDYGVLGRKLVITGEWAFLEADESLITKAGEAIEKYLDFIATEKREAGEALQDRPWGSKRREVVSGVCVDLNNVIDEIYDRVLKANRRLDKTLNDVAHRKLRSPHSLVYYLREPKASGATSGAAEIIAIMRGIAEGRPPPGIPGVSEDSRTRPPEAKARPRTEPDPGKPRRSVPQASRN
jgi:hypothetical protein